MSYTPSSPAATAPQAGNTNNSNSNTADRESEPLLGQPGDATQEEGYPIYYNIFTGQQPQ